MVWIKDPEAVLDFGVNWSKWLSEGETITDHVVTVSPVGVAIDSSVVEGGIVLFWLSGGTKDNEYKVSCRITTSNGRTDERSQTLHVKQR